MIRCGIGGGNYVGWRWWVGRFAPLFFISGLFGWCVMMRGVGGVGAM